MSWQEIQERLADTFTVDGILGQKVGLVIDREKVYERFVERSYRGYSFLSHAFQEFYIETIQAAGSVWREEVHRPAPPAYADLLLWHLANFRTVRAVDILFHNGYPMDGFARLRHLKETALILGAILGGITSYSRVSGWAEIGADTPRTRETMKKIRKNRQDEERRIFRAMLRRESGLRPEYIELLEIWESLFHAEVHGAQLTQVVEFGPAVRGEDTTSVAPTPREDACSMFINRSCEIDWMLLRTFPLMQLTYRAFGDEWTEKWKLLDENFLEMERGLAQIGKPIGDAFISFIETKFPFGPSMCFDTEPRY